MIEDWRLDDGWMFLLWLTKKSLSLFVCGAISLNFEMPESKEWSGTNCESQSEWTTHRSVIIKSVKGGLQLMVCNLLVVLAVESNKRLEQREQNSECQTAEA